VVLVGFRWKFEHAAAKLRYICKHKEVPGFQTEMATKRLNLWTAALTENSCLSLEQHLSNKTSSSTLSVQMCGS